MIRPRNENVGMTSGAALRRTRSDAIASTRISLLALGLFVAVTIAVHSSSGLREAERAFLQGVVAIRTPALTSLARAVTLLGSTAATAAIVVVAAGTAWRRRRPVLAAMPVLAWLGTLVSALLTKASFARARPDPTWWLTYIAGSSYPSQHAALSACTFTAVAWITPALMARPWPSWFPWVAPAALALLVGGSRVYLGVHYPTDVVGGFCLGVFWTSAVARAFRSRTSNLPSIEIPARSPGSRR